MPRLYEYELPARKLVRRSPEAHRTLFLLFHHDRRTSRDDWTVQDSAPSRNFRQAREARDHRGSEASPSSRGTHVFPVVKAMNQTPGTRG